MEPSGGRDSRFNLGYNMNLLSGETSPEIYGNPNLGRPSTSLQQLSPRHTMVSSACNRGLKSDIYDERGLSGQSMGLDSCVNDINEDSYSMQSKKSPPSNGKKTKGRVKIKMEYIENKLRRYTTFSKRKTGIMKKAYELSTLTGTQVMLLVASETGHVYTFATRKLQPMITSEAGKALIQTCLNSPDPPAGSAGGDQRMSATGFEETELTYNISDDDSKDGAESGSDSESEDMETIDEVADIDENMERKRPPEDSLVTPSSKKEALSFENQTNKSKPETNILNNVSKELPPSLNISNLQGAYPIIVSSSSNSSTMTIPATSTIATNVSSIANIVTSTSSTVDQKVMTAMATSSSGVNSNRIQALPLVIQTPTGIGYVTNPDGMILGLLQGPNIVSPQIVAIPIPNVPNINNPNVVTVKTDNKNDSKKS